MAQSAGPSALRTHRHKFRVDCCWAWGSHRSLRGARTGVKL